MGKQVKKWLVFALLALTALFVAEQLLLKFLDWRAKWDDEAFKAYLANPGVPQANKGMIYRCQYQPIAWVYRYRICIRDAGVRILNGENEEEPHYYLVMLGTTGHLTIMPEENGDRETWDRTNIWLVDKNLNVLEDLRKGVEK
jgi:hypothetical protein